MTDDFLDQLQADVFGILSNTPSLALAHKVLDNKGDLEGEIENHLATVNDDSGKCGLAVIVLAVEVEKAEENLPGPPLQVRVDVQTLEMVELNRHPINGTLIHSATAATRVLAALQHFTLGSCILHAGKNPLRPLPLRAGFVGHIVSVRARLNGVTVVARPLAVRDEMVTLSGSVQVTGTLTNGTNPTTFPTLPFAGEGPDGGDMYDYPFDGTKLAYLRWNGGSGYWELGISNVTLGDSYWNGFTSLGTPVDEIVWTPANSETGTPVITLNAGGSALQLTCDTPASAIRYTTDGSFPSPSKTLYTGPITGLSGGMTIRSAAYVAGMPPSDVLNTLLSE